MRQREYRVWVLLGRLCGHVLDFGLWKLREFVRVLLVECYKLMQIALPRDNCKSDFALVTIAPPKPKNVLARSWATYMLAACAC
jgi:hypothetical protein